MFIVKFVEFGPVTSMWIGVPAMLVLFSIEMSKMLSEVAWVRKTNKSMKAMKNVPVTALPCDFFFEEQLQMLPVSLFPIK